MALRAIEREGRVQTGRQIACTVAPDVKAWLDAAEIDWRAELSSRIACAGRSTPRQEMRSGRATRSMRGRYEQVRHLRQAAGCEHTGRLFEAMRGRRSQPLAKRRLCHSGVRKTIRRTRICRPALRIDPAWALFLQMAQQQAQISGVCAEGEVEQIAE